jgi:hypothetical protein
VSSWWIILCLVKSTLTGCLRNRDHLSVLCDNPASPIDSRRGKTSLKGVIITPIVPRLHAIVRREEGRPDSGAKGFRDIELFARHLLSLQFYTRSAEGIIYYLGELARRQHDERHVGRPYVEFRFGPPSNRFPIETCPFVKDPDLEGFSCSPIFVLEENSARPAALAVSYDGVQYSIPSGIGRSMSVLDFTRQVLAVNTSAKQLPASSVLRVVGR